MKCCLALYLKSLSKSSRLDIEGLVQISKYSRTGEQPRRADMINIFVLTYFDAVDFIRSDHSGAVLHPNNKECYGNKT